MNSILRHPAIPSPSNKPSILILEFLSVKTKMTLLFRSMLPDRINIDKIKSSPLHGTVWL